MTDQEINEAVARKLGWTRYHGTRDNPDTISCREPKGFLHASYPDYCHSIEAAWEIVDHCGRRWDVSLAGELNANWQFIILDETYEWRAAADTAPMAICLAFLTL